METASLRRNKLQRQLKRLLLVLFVITSINGVFLWKTLDQLFSSYQLATKSQHLTTLVGDIELLLYEESIFREDPEIDEDSRGHRLAEFRRNIKNNFKEVLKIVGADKKRTNRLKDIQNSWIQAKTMHANRQVLILVNSFMKDEYEILREIDDGVHKSTNAALAFIAIYIGIFSIALVTLSQYFKRRVFQPLSRLSDDMVEFQAGSFQLTARTFNQDEIGHLESKFYEMAERVAYTVEELKELDRVKTDFLSLASHELRTPMTSVKGSLSLILSGNLSEVTPDVKELLLISEKETDRLIRLINDILDLTKIEAHKMPLVKNWFPLTDVIETVIESLQGLFKATGVKVNIEASAVNCEILADKDRVQQVLTNLLSNAIKFSPKGTDVNVGVDFNPKGLVTVSVRDKGPGIKEEDQDHMFEKFRSKDLGKSKIMKGTGLGLPICKALIEEHEGTIGLESEVGVGSTFFFTLPNGKMISRKSKAA